MPQTIPFVRFPPEKNEFSFKPAELEYSFSEKDSSLRLGLTLLSEKSLQVYMAPLKMFDSKLAKKLNKEKTPTLLIHWPTELFQFGTLEVKNLQGEVLWSYVIDASMSEEWQDELEHFADRYKGALQARRNRSNLFWSSGYGIIDFDVDEWERLTTAGDLQICLRQTQEERGSQICRGPLRLLVGANGVYEFRRQAVKSAPVISLDDKQLPLSGIFPVSADQPIKFKAQWDGACSYEFYSQVQYPQLLDIVAGAEVNEVIITGHGIAPVGAEILNPPDRRLVSYIIEWLPTGGDLRRFWRQKYFAKAPAMYVVGTGGGIFRLPFEIVHPPEETARPIPSGETAIYGTYLAQLELPLLGSPAQSIELPVLADWNSHHWEIESGGRKHVAQVDVYRAPTREITGRLGAVISTALQTVAIGDISYLQWFDDFDQRLGAKIYYNDSLYSFKHKYASGEIEYINLGLELHWRMKPTINEWQSAWGIFLANQHLNLSSQEVNLLGGGVSLSGSMPQVFDKILNYIPIFRFKKWVFANASYYPLADKTKLNLGSNYLTNVQIKFQIAPQWFTEVAGGMKVYDLTDAESGSKSSLQSAYWSLGLGYSF